ncbi:MAG: fimbrial assembly protein [Bdellovibrio sp.]|nr:MAG: fimbrial assembly protein [Bdellovibrio sp.]
MWFLSSNKVLGLDIGSSSIKIAELEVGRKGAKLLNFGIVPTPGNALNGGDITDVNAIASAVRGLYREIGAKRTNVAVGLFGTAVIVKKITIPRIEGNLVADQVRWEAEQYIPFDANAVSLEYHIINPKDTSENMDVLLIAAQNELVTAYQNIILQAGLKVGVLDVSAFALANLFEFNYGRPDGATVAILNIGSSITNFVVVDRGEVVFSRDMPIGGQNFTNDIHKEMGVTLVEAESLKLSAAAGGAVPDEVHTIINTTTEYVCEEVRNSFDFFLGSAGNAASGLNQVLYSGGGSATPGLINNLGRVTKHKFDWFDPFVRIASGSRKLSSEYLEQIAPYAGISLGLSLRKAGES